MPTTPRVDFEDAIHHIANRGVRGIDIFTRDRERSKFRSFLDTYKADYDSSLFACALVPNHFHLLLQSRTGRLSNFMGLLQSRYATWFNTRGKRE